MKKVKRVEFEKVNYGIHLIKTGDNIKKRPKELNKTTYNIKRKEVNKNKTALCQYV